MENEKTGALSASAVFKYLKSSGIINEKASRRAASQPYVDQDVLEAESSAACQPDIDHEVLEAESSAASQPDVDHEGLEAESSAAEEEISDSDYAPSSPDLSDSASLSSVISESVKSDSGSDIFPILRDALRSGEGSSMGNSSCVSLTCSQVMTCANDQDTSTGCEASALETKIVNVSTSSGTNKWDKKHCCLYCSKLVNKMSTHLKRVHAEEADVAKALLMPKNSRERRQAFVRLQDQGDYQNNYSVLQRQSGILIPKYRKVGRKPEQFLACPHCKGLYLKSLLAKHARHCQEKPEGTSHRKGQAAQLGRMLLPTSKQMSTSFYQSIVMRMRDDEIRRLIEGDSLILQFGERIFGRRDVEEHTGGQISSRLREMGRLLSLIRRNSDMKVTSLSTALDPANFDLLIKCVKELGDFQHSSHSFKKGNLALKVGYSLKKCSKIVKAEAIKTNDDALRDKMERFESLYDGEWYDSVSACASQSITCAKMNKPKLLPSLADVEKVNILLERDCQSESYPTLAKAVLCAISIFNRKRGGELQRMKCADYEKNKKSALSPPEKEILSNLSNTEKKLVDVLSRVEIRGKFNRPVPILLTQGMAQSIERLLVLRRTMGIESQYLFVTPTGQNPYKGPSVVKQYAEAAGVDDPSLFTSTSLRKQLATLSQAMEINKMDQDQLAAFLGHDIRVHRNIYRQPIDVIQKARVAKILLQVNRGIQVTAENCPEATSSIGDDEIDLDEDDNDVGAMTDEEEEAHPSHDTDLDSLTEKPKMERQRSSPSCAAIQKRTGHSSQHHPQKKRPWSKEEVSAVHKHLSQCIIMNRVPQKHEVERALAAEPALRKRKWKDVKYFVYNLLNKKRKANKHM